MTTTELENLPARETAGSSSSSETAARPPRLRLLVGVLGIAAFVLAIGLGVRASGEAPGTNSYALLAQTFLDAELASDLCYDDYCAFYEGRRFVTLPPLPGVLIAPFVALSGEGASFSHFLPVALTMMAGLAIIWFALYRAAATDNLKSVILTLALLFATPLYYAALWSDQAWFFGQLAGVFFTSLALWAALALRSALLAGFFIGAAFLCRPATIVYLPFLYALMVEDGESLLRVNGGRIGRLARLAAPVVLAVAGYAAFNFIRFGSIWETGASYILAGGSAVHGDMLQGVSGAEALEGIALPVVAASPFLLLLVFVQHHRLAWLGLATIAAVYAATFFAEPPGVGPDHIHRYALDWLPAAMLLLAPTVRDDWRSILAVLAAYGMALNLIATWLLREAGLA